MSFHFLPSSTKIDSYLSSLTPSRTKYKQNKMIHQSMFTPDIIVNNNNTRNNPCLTRLASSSSSFLFDGDYHPEELCKYPSKKCPQRRFSKKNGELHNLCEFHRDKANRNQRRLEMKRKFQKQYGVEAELPEKVAPRRKKKRGDSTTTSTPMPKIKTEFLTNNLIHSNSNSPTSVDKEDDLIVLNDFIAEIWPVVVEQEEDIHHTSNISNSTTSLFNYSQSFDKLFSIAL